MGEDVARGEVPERPLLPPGSRPFSDLPPGSREWDEVDPTQERASDWEREIEATGNGQRAVHDAD